MSAAARYGSGESDGKPGDPLVDVRRSVDELRRSMADVVAGITETQSLVRTQQRQLDDVMRSNSHHRVSVTYCLLIVVVAMLCW